MKPILRRLAAAVALACGLAPLANAVPVLPGAIGHGISTPAGRGGAVVRVTNLDSSGPGSLKACVDQRVLDRLERHDPLEQLDERNLHDFCTALEGVSHFHYLIWSFARGRPVSLLELELQAEVDKYATALALLTQQRAGAFPGALHARMFSGVSFLPQLDVASRHRYEEANRHAARYCRELDQRYLHPRRRQPEKWLAELRRFFRCGHQEKIRQLAV